MSYERQRRRRSLLYNNLLIHLLLLLLFEVSLNCQCHAFLQEVLTQRHPSFSAATASTPAFYGEGVCLGVVASRRQSNNEEQDGTDDNNNGDDDDEYYRTTKNETLFEENFDKLVAYQKEFGTANVPFAHTEYWTLYRWIENLRGKQCILSKYQRSRLEKLGLTLEGARQERFDEKWQEMFQRLVHYKAVHNHTRVPQSYEDEAGVKLGKWVMNQRADYRLGKQSDHHKKQLNDIGFVWKLSTKRKGPSKKQKEAWNRYFKELIQFCRHKGHCRVPRNCSENQTLANWVFRQRYMKKKGQILKGRELRLNWIGFVWDEQEVRWYENYEKAKLMREENPNGSLGQKLSLWRVAQIYHKGKGTLSPEKENLLRDIGIL